MQCLSHKCKLLFVPIFSKVKSLINDECFGLFSGGFRGGIVHGDCALLPVSAAITLEADLEEMMEIRGRPNETNQKRRKAADVKRNGSQKIFFLAIFFSFQVFLFPVNAMGNNMREKGGNKFLVIKIYFSCWWTVGTECAVPLRRPLFEEEVVFSPCFWWSPMIFCKSALHISCNMQINEYAPKQKSLRTKELAYRDN